MRLVTVITETRVDRNGVNRDLVDYVFGGTFMDFVFNTIEEERSSIEEPYELIDCELEKDHAFLIWKWRGAERYRTLDIVKTSTD